MQKKNVVIGFLGTTLDEGGKGVGRWEKWRPTIATCQHEDLLIDRMELFIGKRYRGLAARVTEDIATVSPETEVRLWEMEIRNPWDFEEVYETLHNFVDSYPFDTEKEEYLAHITTGTHVAQICTFLLTEAHFLPAKLLQASPSGSTPGTSIGTYSVIDLDLSRYDRIAKRFQKEFAEATSFLKSGIETRNKNFNDLIDRIETVAGRSDAPILLMGPTGAGKSQLARKIFELKTSKRKVSGQFVEVNCATLHGDGAMSALFGHKKGAFTGAVSDRPGLLKSADGGLLLLDEIGELGLDEQAMLLRAIEEKRFLPLGSDREEQSQFQLIAGTNRDLRKEVGAGRFREDLLTRIDLWTFHMPGLSDRREDIAPNLDYEEAQFAEKTGARVRFNKEAREKFLRFAIDPGALWSANFRDLNASFTRMATLGSGGIITIKEVEEECERLRSSWSSTAKDHDSTLLASVLGDEVLAQLDRFDLVQLAEVISVCRNSRSISDAGRKLFAVSRQLKRSPNDADRLNKYLSRFGLTWSEVSST